MCFDSKKRQIEAILLFDRGANLGPLVVTREDIRAYVRKHGLPKKSPKSGEISYEQKDEGWVITYWEKSIDIGNKSFPDEMTVLEEILDSALPIYARCNPRSLTE